MGTYDGGRLARDLAEVDGIGLRAQESRERTGTAGIYVDAAGRNIIVIGPGANASLSADFVQECTGILGAAAVVLAQVESPLTAVLAGFQIAREAAVVTVLNPAPADAEISGELLALSDVITPNETEFCAQLRRQHAIDVAADAVAGLDDTTLHDHCRRLLTTGSVVITLGAAGCYVSHPNGRQRGDDLTHYRVAAAPANAVDTTGAGDAFNGALVASMAQFPARAFKRHVAFATLYAGRATEYQGAAAAMPLQRPERD